MYVTDAHERLLETNVAHGHRDPFAKADLSQFSCTNSLRRHMLLQQQRPERMDRCRRKYEDFRWEHKKQINSFRQDVINGIGLPCPMNPKEAGFPTTFTFDILEDFKSRLHGRQFKTDKELLHYMQQINKVFEQEAEYLREVRQKVQVPVWNNRPRNPRSRRKRRPPNQPGRLPVQSAGGRTKDLEGRDRLRAAGPSETGAGRCEEDPKIVADFAVERAEADRGSQARPVPPIRGPIYRRSCLSALK
ncbi:hypothetical protein BV898_05809 [Hypsibius exemplaris]|nr:hypothetical protein BV898_05809 [Hypsibius exemplaris]